MTRLFVTLYLLLTAALAGYWVIVEIVPDWLLKPVQQKYAHQNYKGTQYLLEERIKGLSGLELEAAVNEIQQQFEYPIALVEEATLDLASEHKELLDQGTLAEREVDGADQGIYRSSVDGMNWVFESDQRSSEHHRRIAIGTFRMVEALLKAVPKENRGQALTNLNARFGFPVEVETLDRTNISVEERRKLAGGEVLGLNVDTDDERYYYLSPLLTDEGAAQPTIIRFGPIDFPLSTPLIVASFLMLLAVLVAIAVLLWIRPIWSGLTSLGAATKRFGEGDFTARVRFGKRSGIRDIGLGFNQMAERIQNLLGSHRELTNAVSHELRTPLSRMRFSMEMMQNTDSDGDRQRHIRNMSSDIDELDSLVSELLTYARFDRDPANIRAEKVHLPSWLETEFRRIQKSVGEGINVSLEMHSQDLPLIVYAEPRLLGRAISNLVQNARRYARSSIVVRVTGDQKIVRVVVEDDGPGIPDKDRERIFDPFSRLDQSRNRESGGAGLGLSIVRQIAEWHGGQITVDDGASGGARFCLSLPVV